MNSRYYLFAGLMAAMPMAASADALGFRIQANSWQQQFEGEVQDGTEAIDIENTLGIDDETNNTFSVHFEHPIPVLPNLALHRAELEAKGTNTISDSFTFDGETYNINETVNTDADLSHTDAILYYEVLDNWVSVDLGLTVRKFDEGIIIQSQSTPDTVELDIDGALPMLYAAAKFELPLNGLYVGADANGISYQDSSIIDYKVNLGYETDFGLGIEAGMRSFDIDYEDEDDDTERAELTIDGFYAGLFYHF